MVNVWYGNIKYLLSKTILMCSVTMEVWYQKHDRSTISMAKDICLRPWDPMTMLGNYVLAYLKGTQSKRLLCCLTSCCKLKSSSTDCSRQGKPSKSKQKPNIDIGFGKSMSSQLAPTKWPPKPSQVLVCCVFLKSKQKAHQKGWPY